MSDRPGFTYPKKARILKVRDTLIEESDAEHHLSSNDVIAAIGDFGLAATRETIYHDIKTLEEAGLPVKKASDGTYVSDAFIPMQDLLFIADAVRSAQFLSESDSKGLLLSLMQLCSRHQAAKLRGMIHVFRRPKATNRKVLAMVTTLDAAVRSRKLVAFAYLTHTAGGKLVPRHDGKRYVARPLEVAYDQGKYYIIALEYPPDEPKHFRVDRMVGLEVVEPRGYVAPGFTDAQAQDYLDGMLGMYSGRSSEVTLIVDESVLDPIYDNFDPATTVSSYVHGGRIRVSIRANVTPVFYGWLAQFGDRVVVESPSQVKVDYIEHLKKILRAQSSLR